MLIGTASYINILFHTPDRLFRQSEAACAAFIYLQLALFVLLSALLSVLFCELLVWLFVSFVFVFFVFFAMIISPFKVYNFIIICYNNFILKRKKKKYESLSS